MNETLLNSVAASVAEGADLAAGVTAFVKKRKPNFKGR